jgi:hypothetical protein
MAAKRMSAAANPYVSLKQNDTAGQCNLSDNNDVQTPLGLNGYRGKI